MTGPSTTAEGTSNAAPSETAGREEALATSWAPPRVTWTAIGLITSLIAVGVALIAEPGWFEATELGPGGISFLAPLAVVVVGAGARSGAIGNWNQGVKTAKWLLSGVVGGLTVVGVWQTGFEGSGAALAALAVITFALGIPVFLMGTVAGNTWSSLRNNSAGRLPAGRPASIDRPALRLSPALTVDS